MKLLQINTTVNSGSTGRIAEDIGELAIAQGHESYIAYGRGNRPSQSQLLRIGSQCDVYWHGLQTVLFDRHGLASRKPTLQLVEMLDKLKPDIIHLHNLHGYYLNIEVLFRYLSVSQLPVVWTLHDCWPFTGHCSHYQDIGCEKWKTHCHSCPKSHKYPKALIDNSFTNFNDKKRIFTSIKKDRLKLVVPSHWLKSEVSESFLKQYKVKVINNGIDLETFKSRSHCKNDFSSSPKVILGVANVWQKSKGIYDFIELSKLLSDDYIIKLVGLEKKNNFRIPSNIICIPKTQSIEELASIYSEAFVFLNPTYLDNFPTTNLEALACGTPVVTYNTGGSPEAIDEETGLVVEKGDILGLKAAIEKIAFKGKNHYQGLCRARAESYFDKNDRYRDYLNLYQQLIHT